MGFATSNLAEVTKGMTSTLEDASVDTLKASRVIGRGFPTDEGERLARYLLSNTDADWAKMAIDLTDCDSGLLISAFFNAFLQAIHDQAPEHLDDARSVDWNLEFGFQRENVAEWMADFQPYSLR